MKIGVASIAVSILRGQGSAVALIVLGATILRPLRADDIAIAANEPRRTQPPTTYTLKSWDTEAGLPQMTPTAITQTRDGYLWIGTYNGLSRFDGVRFTSFTVNNTPELASDHILALHEDAQGVLWIGTAEGGLLRYRGGRFSRDLEPGEPASMTVSAIAEDETGRLWIGTSKGLRTISIHSEGERFTSSRFLPGEEVIAVVRGRAEEMWASTRRTAHQFISGQCVESVIAPGEIHTMAVDRHGDPWVSYAAGGFGRWSAAKRTMDLINRRAKLNAMYLANDGALLAGTLSGELWHIDRSFTNYHRAATKLPEKIVSIYTDRDGNIWTGLEAHGLWRIRRSSVAHVGIKQGLLTPYVTSLCEDRHGRIWAGTFGKGLHFWDGDKFNPIKMPTAPNITALVRDRAGKLWFGTYGGALGWLDDVSQDIVLDMEKKYGERCRALFEDSKGGLWIGTLNNGVEYHQAGKVIRFRTSEGLSDDHIRAIAEDGAGDVWVGTSKGLNRFVDGRFQQFHIGDGLGGEQVRALFCDSQGTLWIGSSGGGLSRWKNGKLENVGLKEGLINDWIEQIVQDDHGFLWLGSNDGLMRVNLQKLNDCVSRVSPFVHCTVFRRDEGLILPNSGTGFQPSALKTSDGKLWFASDAGIAIINPAEVRTQRRSPAVHIEEMVVDQSLQLIRIHDKAVREPLAAGAHRIEFHYTGLDPSAPALVRFRHKLEGFDTDWVNAGTRREAVYTRLRPGDYRFRVVAANNQGTWNEEGASLAFSVLPRFWQTLTFQITAPILSVFLTGLIVWGLISGKHRHELEMLKRKHELERERARIAQDMHDGLGSSLVKISLLGEQAERCFGETDHAEPQVRKMTAAARQVMREMDEIVWAVNPKNDTLENFASYLCAFAREQFSDTAMECHMDIPTNLPPDFLRSEVRHNLFLAVREALNNVLKHSQARHVWIAIEIVRDQLIIAIRDDGNGFRADRPMRGNGLSNMRERLARLGGQVVVEENSNGTMVRFGLTLS